MKSIIEQASSIIKAIEKAWDQAEKPKEFSIKIFEQEERNFFGMSTKPAKVGIFFGDKPIIHEKTTSKPRPEIKECRPEVRENKQHKAPFSRPEQPVRTATTASVTNNHIRPHAAVERPQTAEQPQKINSPETERARRIPTTWNDSMIASAHHWLRQTLSLMDMPPTIDFNSEVAGRNLKLTFNVPLIEDVMHEKQLFRSFAHLIMSSLRNQYKQEIRDLKVILIRPE